MCCWSAAIGNGWFALAGHDVAEGKVRAEIDAKRQAEALARFCAKWLPP
jgi:hypothetical protein